MCMCVHVTERPMQSYPGGVEYAGQVPQGYQPVAQYPVEGYAAQPPASYGQPGPPIIQPSYAATTQYPGQMAQGYQPVAQYPSVGYGPQPTAGYGQAGQPLIQPSYAAPAQQLPPPPAGLGDDNFQLPPNGT